MLTFDLLQEFIKANKIPISKDWEKNIACIEFAEDPTPLRFPGSIAGLILLFISSSHLYGFNIDIEKFSNLFPQNTHKNSCFHIKEILKNPQNFFLEQADLKPISNFLSKNKAKKLVKETLFLITSGPFHLKQDFEIETEKRKEKILALTLNQSLIIGYVKKLCKSAFEKKIISFKNFYFDLEYLTEVVLDNFQNHLWESVVKEYKGIPIYQVDFSGNGSFKLKDMGTV